MIRIIRVLFVRLPNKGDFEYYSTKSSLVLNLKYMKKIQRLVVALFVFSSVAFAQVYVGVHYPLDVLAGGALGALIGYAMAQWYRSLDRYNMTVRI